MVTPALVAINIGVFVAMLLAGFRDEQAIERIYHLGQVGGGPLRPYTLVTSAFLHGGFAHLLGNMLSLWVFGPPVEDRLGRWWFLAFYLAGAVVSGLAHALLEVPPAIGASGAIAGVTGAFIVLFPRTRVRCFMFFFVIGLVMVPAWFLIGLRIAFDVLSEAMGVQGDIAIKAHLGGYAFGIAVALILLQTKILSREPYDLLTIFKHGQRRRAFKAAMAQAGPTRPERAAKRNDPEADDLAQRRAVVSTLLASNSPDAAADAYEELIHAYTHRPHAGTLSRDAQLRLVAHLLNSDRRALAARALDGFLATYPADSERTGMTILLARVLGHDLQEVAKARALLTPIAETAPDEHTRAIAREELANLATEGSP